MNRELLVSPDVALLEAMDRLTRGSAKIVFVVDTDDVLVGTLTDGAGIPLVNCGSCFRSGMSTSCRSSMPRTGWSTT